MIHAKMSIILGFLASILEGIFCNVGIMAPLFLMKPQTNGLFVLIRKAFTNTFIISDKVFCLFMSRLSSYVSFINCLLAYVMSTLEIEVLALRRA
jgi:hypothetical protein